MSGLAPAPAQRAARGADAAVAAGKQSAHLHAAAVALAAAAPSVSAFMGARSRAVAAAGRCEPPAQARALLVCGARLRLAHAAPPPSRGRATFAALCCCPATPAGTLRREPPRALWVPRLSLPRTTAPQCARALVQGRTRRRWRRKEHRHDAVQALQPRGTCCAAERAARVRADAAAALLGRQRRRARRAATSELNLRSWTHASSLQPRAARPQRREQQAQRAKHASGALPCCVPCIFATLVCAAPLIRALRSAGEAALASRPRMGPRPARLARRLAP